MVCTFSTSQLPKVVRPWCALYILPWKCASGHNGALMRTFSTSQFPKVARPWHVICFFSHFWLGNVLRATAAYNFSSLIWQDGSAPTALASLLSDPLLTRPTFASPSFHIVGSLTSKLPSVIYDNFYIHTYRCFTTILVHTSQMLQKWRASTIGHLTWQYFTVPAISPLASGFGSCDETGGLRQDMAHRCA